MYIGNFGIALAAKGLIKTFHLDYYFSRPSSPISFFSHLWLPGERECQ